MQEIFPIKTYYTNTFSVPPPPRVFFFQASRTAQRTRATSTWLLAALLLCVATVEGPRGVRGDNGGGGGGVVVGVGVVGGGEVFAPRSGASAAHEPSCEQLRAIWR